MVRADSHCAVVFEGSVFVIGGTNDPYSCMADVEERGRGKAMREMCFAPGQKDGNIAP